MGDLLMPIALLGFLLLVLLVVITLVVKNLVYVCQPSEVLVFSGATRQVGPRTVGYRVVKGGRALRVPLLETVDRMDLSNMQVEVRVAGAYSKGGIPLAVQGVANIKGAGEEPLLNNALERFLGKGREEIMAIARETVEGALRGVLAHLTPEQVNEDKQTFSAQLTREAETDLQRLGLVIDTLNIQNITDEVGYLASIGRQRSAQVRRNAQVREAEMQAEAAERRWENHAVGEVAKITAEIEILRRETDRRMRNAQTVREAMIAEERGKVQAAVAQAKAELSMQTARIEQVRRQLQADVVQPADARRKAAERNAKGDAAAIVERGRATAEVLRRMNTTYAKSGGAGREILLLQKLQPMLEALMTTVQHIRVDSITVLGESGPNGHAAGESLAGKLARTTEQIRAATGIDLPRIVQDKMMGPAKE